MRFTTLLTLILFTATVYSQSEEEKFVDSTLKQIKIENQVDKNDLKIFALLETFYNEVLQSDKGELSEQTAKKINAYLTDGGVNNKHLLILFLMYQEHISETAAQGKQPNSNYQLACISLLETEMETLYQKISTIVYVYKVEALQSAGRNDEARDFIESALKKVPTSIPLKVYKYLDSKDENIKRDLLNNHSQHWMVLQFGIK